MNLLEYQGNQLFARHGVPVPSGSPATTVEEAVAAADEIGYPCVIKAQVQIGGGGEARGGKGAKEPPAGAGDARAGPAAAPPGGALPNRLYDAFVAEEAMLVEVNPLIVTSDRQVTALDAKVTLDDNSLFRHADNAGLRNLSAEDPQERMARERGLTFVKLDGNVGILGNGAG